MQRVWRVGQGQMIDGGAKKIGLDPEDRRVKCSDLHCRKGHSGALRRINSREAILKDRKASIKIVGIIAMGTDEGLSSWLWSRGQVGPGLGSKIHRTSRSVGVRKGGSLSGPRRRQCRHSLG